MANHHTRENPSPTEQESGQLRRWARRPKTAQALALRARIVLASAEGLSDAQVAEKLSVSRPTASKWRRRFLERGCDGLADERRPARSVTTMSRESSSPPWSRPRGMPRTGASAAWRSTAASARPRRAGSGRLSRCSPTGAKPSGCPGIRCSSRRCVTLSVSACRRRNGRWSCAWTRSRRSRR